jgi:gamma-D-glutamyl-L-lysine dipeptidyl-peptidase
MKTAVYFKTIFPFLLLVLLYISCSDPAKQDALINEITADVQERYAPDRRVAVFDIEWERVGTDIVIRGDVDNTDARDELIRTMSEAGIGTVVDSIRILPAPELGDETHGLVRLSVGNVRAEPRNTSELVTQVLMGTPVRILKQRGEWLYVQSPDRYLGWINGGAIQTGTESMADAWDSAEKVIVTTQHAILYERANNRSQPVSNAVIGGLLKRTGRIGAFVAVELPDGRTGFIESANVEEYRTWRESRRPTGESIAETAKMFMGIPYLWGGTSAKGFDCSGYTKTVFGLHGIELQRDASQQVLMGEHVDPGEDFENLRVGDMLFFGRPQTDDRPERIVHVAIYLGNKEFIHASTLVQIESLDPSAPHYNEYERNRFVRVRRYLP